MTETDQDTAVEPRNRGWGDYPRLWTASATSSLGDGVRMTALPLLAVSYTTNPVALALVTAAGTLPMLLSPLAGVAADRWDRRSLLVRVDLGRFLLVALLALAVFTKLASLPLICVVALLLGLGETLFVITSQTFLPQVVHTTRIASAYGRLQAAQVVCRDTLGQPLGGLLFAASMALPFLVDGVSFLVGVALLVTVRVLTPAKAKPGGGAGWGAMVKEGVRYLRGDKLLLTLALMLGYINFFFVGVSAILVLYVLQRLGLDKTAFGFFLAAGALGGVLGGVLGSKLRDRFGVFPAALTSLGVAGACVLLMGLTRQPVLAAAAFGVFSFGIMVYQVLTVSFRQATVPSAVLGRINGVYRLLGTGTAPIGALVGGGIAAGLGVQVPLLVAGAALLLLALAVAAPVIRMSAQRGEHE